MKTDQLRMALLQDVKNGDNLLGLARQHTTHVLLIVARFYVW